MNKSSLEGSDVPRISPIEKFRPEKSIQKNEQIVELFGFVLNHISEWRTVMKIC